MGTVKTITPKELKALLDAGEAIQIIDVREDWEVMRGKLPEAIHIPMDDIPDSLDKIAKDKSVVIMCHSGSRSMQVAAWLQQAQGFTNVINLTGGIAKWSKDVDPSIPG